NDNNPDSLNIEPQVDPNDRVNVELWNRLNAEDEKTMPTITDYSDEVTATAWLKWYFRIAQRHHQVKLKLNTMEFIYISFSFFFFYLGKCTSSLEL
ncbi:unnamed protein product, partial [Rotaria magnacalcarata]